MTLIWTRIGLILVFATVSVSWNGTVVPSGSRICLFVVVAIGNVFLVGEAMR